MHITWVCVKIFFRREFFLFLLPRKRGLLRDIPGLLLYVHFEIYLAIWY